MIFNSLVYFAFLGLVLLLFHGVLRSVRQRNWLLFAAGSVFYAAWSLPFLILLYATIVIDWAVGRVLETRPDLRRRVLLASIAFNLGTLAIFKYTNFAATNLETVVGWLGADLELPRLAVDLPLGISFYTFLSLSYTIDVYRRVKSAEQSLLNYSVFVTFFPHLIAGPILRAREFLPQVVAPDRSRLRVSFGINRIVLGLVKKVVIADWLAQLVEPVYASPAGYDGIACVIATYCYAFQIYCDFSGYIDIAVGSACLLGYDLPPNFDSPYLARNISDFWRRWHITLSNWLRDYVYITLGGNRHGRLRMYLALLATMLIGGLWHGPSWNFVIWGAIHGVLLVLHKWHGEVRGRRSPPEPDPYQFSVQAILVFNLVCVSWVFFRAPTTDVAWAILQRIGGIPGAVGAGELSWTRVLLAVAVSPGLLLAYTALTRIRRKVQHLGPASPGSAWVYGAVLALLATLIAAAGAPPAQFIYFVF